MSHLLRLLAVVALSAVSALGPACSSDNSSPEGDGGTAIDVGADSDLSVDFGLPDADSDGGYRSDTAGQDCDADRDCESGEICIGADPGTDTPGYCSILDCDGHLECDFGLDDAVFCCSDFGEFRGCFRESEGALCGDGMGEQGADCSAGGQSDCAGEEFFCIDLFGAQFCSGQCDPRAPTSCPGGSWCFPTGGTDGLCVPGGETPSGESCAESPGSCQPGLVCDGGFTDPPSSTSFCAALCTRTRDCLATEWCRVYPGQDSGTCIPVGGGEQGTSCAEDRWACQEGLYCSSEGTRFAHCVQLCERPADCDDGFACDFFSTELGVCNPVGDRETGEPCGDDPFSCVEGAVCIGVDLTAGYNSGAYCSESCATNPTACGDGFYCQDFGDSGSFCLPDGDAGPGDPCSGPTDCQADTFCLYQGLGGDDVQGRCQPTCSTAVPCGGGEWCTGGDEGGVCLVEGDLQVGDECGDEPFDCPEETFCGDGPPICLAPCTDDPSLCPSGFYCPEGAPDQDRFCVPFGDTPVGESCDAAGECEQGSVCAFLDGNRGGVCSHGCDSDADCPTSLWCLRSPLISVCVPEGSAPSGASCADDRFSCAAGNICVLLESDAAYCARDCTGFIDRCGEDEVCRWVGSGLSLCLTVGDIATGAPCAEDPTGCEAGSTCFNPGDDDALCAGICTFNPDACTTDTVCTFSGGGVGLCLPPDL